jgi:hypothetical protein
MSASLAMLTVGRPAWVSLSSHMWVGARVLSWAARISASGIGIVPVASVQLRRCLRTSPRRHWTSTRRARSGASPWTWGSHRSWYVLIVLI